jgi:hypothetical protein
MKMNVNCCERRNSENSKTPVTPSGLKPNPDSDDAILTTV